MVTQNKQAPADVNLSTEESLKAELERMKKEMAALEAKQAKTQLGKGTISVKVVPREKVLREVEKNGKKVKEEKDEGGNIRTYGLGRFPVSLYAGQQDRYDSPEVMAMRCQAIIDNIDLLVFDEATPGLNAEVKRQVLHNAKVRLAFLATFDDFASKFKG